MKHFCVGMTAAVLPRPFDFGTHHHLAPKSSSYTNTRASAVPPHSSLRRIKILQCLICTHTRSHDRTDQPKYSNWLEFFAGRGALLKTSLSQPPRSSNLAPWASQRKTRPSRPIRRQRRWRACTRSCRRWRYAFLAAAAPASVQQRAAATCATFCSCPIDQPNAQPPPPIRSSQQRQRTYNTSPSSAAARASRASTGRSR